MNYDSILRAVLGRQGRTPDRLPPQWRERWSERAAIMDFDGGLPRAQADAEALAWALKAMQQTSERLSTEDAT